MYYLEDGPHRRLQRNITLIKFIMTRHPSLFKPNNNLTPLLFHLFDQSVSLLGVIVFEFGDVEHFVGVEDELWNKDQMRKEVNIDFICD